MSSLTSNILSNAWERWFVYQGTYMRFQCLVGLVWYCALWGGGGGGGERVGGGGHPGAVKTWVAVTGYAQMSSHRVQPHRSNVTYPYIPSPGVKPTWTPTDGFWTGARPTPCLWSCVPPTEMVSEHDGCLSNRVWTKTSPSDTLTSSQVPIFIKRTRNTNSLYISYGLVINSTQLAMNYPIFSHIFTHKSRSQPGRENNIPTTR